MRGRVRWRYLTHVGIPDLRAGSSRKSNAKGTNSLAMSAVALVALEGVGAGGGVNPLGTNVPRTREMHAATNDTEMVCTCSRARLPVRVDHITAGSSNSPTLDAVLRRAERFISRFPLRLSRVGTIMMSWSTSCIARQCYLHLVSSSTFPEFRIHLPRLYLVVFLCQEG